MHSYSENAMYFFQKEDGSTFSRRIFRSAPNEHRDVLNEFIDFTTHSLAQDQVGLHHLFVLRLVGNCGKLL